MWVGEGGDPLPLQLVLLDVLQPLDRALDVVARLVRTRRLPSLWYS